MNFELTPVEHEGQRVLTTQQLAEGYGVDPQIITNNFNRNKERYLPNVHYFALDGEGKRAFINQNQFDVGLKNAQNVYLWTQRGALYHAKSLNTDRAWKVYDVLVDTYFEITAIKKQLRSPFRLPETYSEALRALADEVEKREAVESEKLRLLPKAESYDSLMSSKGLLSVGNVSKILNYKGLGPQNIFKALVLEDVFFGKSPHYSTRQEYIRRGYFVERAKTFYRGDKATLYKQIFVTTKGLKWLDRFLGERGYVKAIAKEVAAQ